MESDPHSQRQNNIPYIQLQDQPSTHDPQRQDPHHSKSPQFSEQKTSYEYPVRLPFHQTANYGAQAPVFDYDRAQVLAQIRTLEATLEEGVFKGFSIMLYVLIILSCAFLVDTIIYAVVQENVISFLINFLCAFWMIYQSALEIRALQLKCSSKAKNALMLMVIYTVLNVGAVVFYFVWFSHFDDIFNYSYLQARQEYVLQVSIVFCISLAAHVGTLVGAIKVYQVLKRRDFLNQQIEIEDSE